MFFFSFHLKKGAAFFFSRVVPYVILLDCLEVWFMCNYVFAKFNGHPVKEEKDVEEMWLNI